MVLVYPVVTHLWLQLKKAYNESCMPLPLNSIVPIKRNIWPEKGKTTKNLFMISLVIHKPLV